MDKTGPPNVVNSGGQNKSACHFTSCCTLVLFATQMPMDPLCPVGNPDQRYPSGRGSTEFIKSAPCFIRSCHEDWTTCSKTLCNTEPKGPRVQIFSGQVQNNLIVQAALRHGNSRVVNRLYVMAFLCFLHAFPRCTMDVFIICRINDWDIELVCKNEFLINQINCHQRCKDFLSLVVSVLHVAVLSVRV